MSGSVSDSPYRDTTSQLPASPSQQLTVIESLKRYVSNSYSTVPVEDSGEQEGFIERGPRPRNFTDDDGGDLELKSVQFQNPASRSLEKNINLYEEERVNTARGSLLVAVQGDRSKPAIVTYHDLGLNHVANFQAFFNYSEMRSLCANFCVYHVNAPGQEENAPTLPEGFVYPTMEELAEQLCDVMLHFDLKSFIGLGVGTGANILVRFALAHPERVDALCLINCISTTAGWIEWGYQKMNTRHLRNKGMTQGTLDYLMWHHFGRMTEERNHDLVHVYQQYFEHHLNPANLAPFIDSYVQRTDLNIVRELDPLKKNTVRSIRVPVLNMTGAFSPHVDDTVTFNGRLDPTNSTWMKLQDCGMVLEEQPGKVVEALRLFLQGHGYALKLARKVSVTPTTPEARALVTSSWSSPPSSSTSFSASSSSSSSSVDLPVELVDSIRITENPFGPATVAA